MTMVEIPCQASTGPPEVPLWECPCRACTRMEWYLVMEFERDYGNGEWPSLREYRRAEWPEHYK